MEFASKHFTRRPRAHAQAYFLDSGLPPFREQCCALARRQPRQGIGRFVVGPIAADARRSSEPVLQRQLGFGQLRTRRDANRNEDKTGVVGQRRQNPTRDRLGTLVKFVPPVVARGKVYAVTYDDAVHVYGLLGRRQEPRRRQSVLP